VVILAMVEELRENPDNRSKRADSPEGVARDAEKLLFSCFSDSAQGREETGG